MCLSLKLLFLPPIVMTLEEDEGGGHHLLVDIDMSL